MALMVISFQVHGPHLLGFSAIGVAAVDGIQGFPAVAGALAQLVQLDLAAAEMALLTVLTQPVLARAMGVAAARRARVVRS